LHTVYLNGCEETTVNILTYVAILTTIYQFLWVSWCHKICPYLWILLEQYVTD